MTIACVCEWVCEFYGSRQNKGRPWNLDWTLFGQHLAISSLCGGLFFNFILDLVTMAFPLSRRALLCRPGYSHSKSSQLHKRQIQTSAENVSSEKTSEFLFCFSQWTENFSANVAVTVRTNFVCFCYLFSISTFFKNCYLAFYLNE